MSTDHCVLQDPTLSKLRHGLLKARALDGGAWRTDAVKDLARRLVLTKVVLSQFETLNKDEDSYDESDAEVNRDYAIQVLFKLDSDDLCLVLEALLSIHRRMLREWVAIAGDSSDDIAAIADGLDEDAQDKDGQGVFQALARGLVHASCARPGSDEATNQLTVTALTTVFDAAPTHFLTLVLSAVEGLTAMFAIARTQHHPAGKYLWLE